MSKVINIIAKLNELYASMELLEKGKKDLLNMYKPEHMKTIGEPHVKWVTENMPNQNWQQWAVRNHAKNPESFKQEHKDVLKHFIGMGSQGGIDKVRFDNNDDIDSGIKKLKSKEEEYINSKSSSFIEPDKETTEFKPTKQNRSWYSLNKPSCEKEGAAMGHCGNTADPHEGDNILSLRDVFKDVTGKKHYISNLTFIENNGYLGEMKGRGNKKPHKRYHSDIVALLSDPKIKGIGGGGYSPENNFEFSDLSKEDQARVLKANPSFKSKLMADDVISNQEIPAHFIDDSEGLEPKHYEQILNSSRFNGNIGLNIKLAMARDPNLDPKYHEQLINDEDYDVRSIMAENHNLDPKYHEQLVNDENEYIRRGIAENPNLDPKYHEQLVNDKDYSVRSSMAENPNLDPKYHEQLVNDEDGCVRGGMALNPNLDPKYHEQLVNDEDYSVRGRIARNPKLDPKYHGQLANDEHADVRYGIAVNPNLDPKYHEQLVNDEDRFARRGIAKNPNLDPKYHGQLANDKDEFVRRSIAENPNLDPKYHEQLVNDEDRFVTNAMMNNPNYKKIEKSSTTKTELLKYKEKAYNISKQDTEVPMSDKIIDITPDGHQEVIEGKEKLNKDKVKDKWKKIKKALSHENAFMSMSDADGHDEMEEDQQEDQGDQSSDEGEADQDDMHDDHYSHLADLLGDDQEDDKSSSVSDGDEGADNSMSPEEMTQVLKEMGHSDSEIAHIVHGINFPEVDEAAKQKEELHRQKLEHELKAKQQELDLNGKEAEIEHGHKDNMFNIEAGHASKINDIEAEHHKKMKELEYDHERRKKELEIKHLEEELKQKLKEKAKDSALKREQKASKSKEDGDE